MSTQNCKFFKIVSSKYCTVWHCPRCGTIDLQLGDLALRLSPAQVEGIVSALSQALRVLESTHKAPDALPQKPLLPH